MFRVSGRARHMWYESRVQREDDRADTELKEEITERWRVMYLQGRTGKGEQANRWPLVMSVMMHHHPQRW